MQLQPAAGWWGGRPAAPKCAVALALHVAGIMLTPARNIVGALRSTASFSPSCIAGSNMKRAARMSGPKNTAAARLYSWSCAAATTGTRSFHTAHAVAATKIRGAA